MRNDTRTLLKQVFSRSHPSVWEPRACTYAHTRTVVNVYTLTRTRVQVRVQTETVRAVTFSISLSIYFFLSVFARKKKTPPRTATKAHKPRESFTGTTREPLPKQREAAGREKRREGTNSMSFKPNNNNNNKKTVGVTHLAVAESASPADDSSVPGFFFFFYPHNKRKTFFLRSGNLSNTGPSGSCAAAAEITGGALWKQK